MEVSDGKRRRGNAVATWPFASGNEQICTASCLFSELIAAAASEWVNEAMIQLNRRVGHAPATMQPATRSLRSCRSKLISITGDVCALRRTLIEQLWRSTHCVPPGPSVCRAFGESNEMIAAKSCKLRVGKFAMLGKTWWNCAKKHSTGHAPKSSKMNSNYFKMNR
ncbi:unnamed protein product [Hermetia illucens]|uniref:Uncharacterized protein n=1 Tax=Hermetia illucens TaxID=343691 RepID=A0A7R8U9R9_HERIL|nr:unnamed protein product [Hermetia illucens]